MQPTAGMLHAQAKRRETRSRVRDACLGADLVPNVWGHCGILGVELKTIPFGATAPRWDWLRTMGLVLACFSATCCDVKGPPFQVKLVIGMGILKSGWYKCAAPRVWKPFSREEVHFRP